MVEEAELAQLREDAANLLASRFEVQGLEQDLAKAKSDIDHKESVIRDLDGKLSRSEARSNAFKEIIDLAVTRITNP